MRVFLKILRFLFFFILFYSPLARSGESLAPLSLSLPDALRLAKERHVDILVANERVQQALTRITQQRSAFFPRLDGSLSLNREKVNLKTFGIDPQVVGINFDLTPPAFNVFDARVTLQQNLFDMTVFKRLNAARSGQRLSVAEQEKAREDALALVATLYVNAQRAQEAAQYLQALQRRDESRLRNAQSQSQLGLGSHFQVTEAKTVLAQTQNQVAVTRAQEQERRFDLAAALGLPMDQPIRFVSGGDFAAGNLPSEEEIRNRIQSHPDVEVARRQVKVKEDERQGQVAEYYPKLTAAGNLGPNGPSPWDVVPTYTYGGGVTVPIYQGGLRKARVQEATSQLKESRLKLEQEEKDRLAQALSSRQSLIQARAGLQSAAANRAQASQYLNLARQRFQLGVGDELQVVEAQAQFASAQDIDSEARATYRQAWVQMQHALGRMNDWTGEGQL